MDKDKLKREYQSKFTYTSGYGVTMEPKSFEKSFEWFWNKLRPFVDAKKEVPNGNRDVLVITTENGMRFYHVAQYWDGKWYTHSEQLHFVTDWMELPPFRAVAEKI
jgi:hypothetical protein